MHVYRLNEPLFKLDADHIARRFLETFIQVRNQCMGRELDGIDQRWWSPTDKRYRTFSSFAYEHLSFDVQLDGWLSHSPEPTDSERAALRALPYSRALMRECREAAQAEQNLAVVNLTDLVLNMLELWEQSIETRLPARNWATERSPESGPEENGNVEP
jgi:hypothetical protein